MGPRAFLALSLLLAAPAPSPAFAADLSPTATRIMVADKTQVYRSFGVAREGELYAPVGPALEGLGLEVSGEGRHVFLRSAGKEVRWRVLEIPPDQGSGDRPISVPEGEEPRVLRIGDTLFLPVKAAAEAAGYAVNWDEGTRLLSLVPLVTDVEVVDPSQGAVAEAPLQLRIAASGPVRAKPMLLRSPWRLVVDLSPAVLRLGEGMPAARGPVQTIRAGQFAPTTVRVVIEAGRRLTLQGLPTAPARELMATLALGVPDARSPLRAASGAEEPEAASPPAKSKSRRATTRRPRQLASRGGIVRRDPELLEQLRAAAEGVLAGRVICVDAGHGGDDPGAKGVDGLWEKDMTLAMAQELARALREVGAVVLMTREDDRFVSLTERVDFANGQGCDLFISIHCNSTPRRNSASGTETYYCTAQSFDLAQAIHGAVAGFVAGRDGGVRLRRFAVVRRTTMPSVLVEVAYINHTGDAARLADPDFRRGVGDAIRDGVLAYYGAPM
jgi:N-acetylmuramoyl-L-alanine amidase